ncbi:hypothetical protein DSO57_1020228 [Entomophthora muscae]|uniref:Uncharacterized protein n=1 Tax=Entomophthora muscae TaxID=34485 RepID=A0ACC2SSV1_9FUNG|nr:hypothetical protein DSO57_1020228 [Entomophthora muscae]
MKQVFFILLVGFGLAQSDEPVDELEENKLGLSLLGLRRPLSKVASLARTKPKLNFVDRYIPKKRFRGLSVRQVAQNQSPDTSNVPNAIEHNASSDQPTWGYIAPGAINNKSLVPDQLVLNLIRDSGGSTPHEVTPSRYTPRTGQLENVSSFPGSEEDAHRFANYAGMSYCSPQAIRAMNCKACQRLGSGVIVAGIYPGYSSGGGQTVIMVDKRNQEIILAFRGEGNTETWIASNQFTMTSTSFAKDAKVHSGFRQATNSIMLTIIMPVIRALRQYPNYRLIITGHSLGGSVATLTFSELLYRRIAPANKMSLFTYGEPRTGNLAFARWINLQQTHITRVVNENDIVPHINPATLGYVHHSTELYIRSNTSTICSIKQVEDIRCSLGRFPNLSVAANNMAWDVPIGPMAC